MILNRKVRTINRVRAKISGTAARPRLAVFRSLSGITGQLIDDTKGVTLVSASSKEIKKVNPSADGIAEETGKLIAKKAKEKKIVSAVFDRRSCRYHGRVKAFAEGARAEGLKL